MDSLRIGSLVFQGGAGQEGFFIEGQGLKGWFSGVASRPNNVPRSQAHGSFDVPVFLDDRIVTVSGKCYATSEERLDYYGAQLTGLLAQGDSQRAVVELAGKTTWADCRRAAAPDFDIEVWGSIASYQLQLWCPNPRKFGNTNTPAAGMSVTSFHYGNFPATSVITISGTMTGYTVAGPAGKLYTVTQAVVAGHPHVIDMATGLLSIDGVYVTGVVTRGDTWAVPPGVQVVQTLTPVSGSGTMSVATLDTFI